MDVKPNTMKSPILFCFVLLLTNYTSAQSITITDNLSWFTGVSTLITSPNYGYCKDDSLNYSIQTFSGSDISAYDSPTYTPPTWTSGVTGGIFIPGNYLSNSSSSVNVVITFSQPITDLRILLADLDAPSNTSDQESITSITPAFQSLSATSSFFATSATPDGYTSIVAQNPAPPYNKVDNCYGWIEWTNIVPTSTFSFNYNRITGTAIGIEGMEIYCTNEVTGLKENMLSEKNQKILVSPNPGQGMYTVDIDEFNFSGATASIYAVDGSIIDMFKVTSSIFELDIQNQDKGTYFLKLVSNDGISLMTPVVFN